jgi:hypothetical protein
VKLNKLSNDLRSAHHLSDSQYQVCSGYSFAESAGQIYADDVGSKEVDGLAQHCCFGFDSTNTPTDNSQTIYHCRV